MKIATFNSFNFRGSDTLPAGFVAVGIAPGSWVDTCNVGGFALGPCSIVPWQPTITARRGLRTRSADGGQGTAFQQDQLDKLELLFYEKCDAIVPPGPRAPVIVSGNIVAGQLGADPTGAGTPPSLLMRIPFFGRRMASIQVRRINNFEADLNIVVRGVKYVPRDIYAGGAGATVYFPFVDEVSDTVWKGGATAPTSVVQGWVNQGGAGTVIPTGTFLGTNVMTGDTIYVGGVDNQENYDELEVYVYNATVGTTAVYGVGEAFGERVL